MTYSKGPWSYDAESGEVLTSDRTGFWGPDHEPVSVCTVTPLDGVNNGPLLAAAQEMLEALKGLDEALCRSGRPLTREERIQDRKRLIAARGILARLEASA